MITHSDFFEFVRDHRARLPRLSRLLDGLVQARREAAITDRPFDLFLYRNPDYWPRQVVTLARELDEMRQTCIDYPVDELQDAINDANHQIATLLARDWFFGKGYWIVSLRARIARLEEFLLLKRLARDWPSSEALLAAGFDSPGVKEE